MMAQVTEESLTLLKDEGAYLCHIDENEYEHLKILFDLTGPPNAGTVVWDKRNPMLGGVGIATQHEYVLWRTSRTGPVFLKNGTLGLILDTARDLVQEHGGVNAASRTAFSKWLASYPGLTGGERAYKFLDDDGRIYQSVALGAPEKRTDPKFHRPLLHPRTKKPCPVPPNGWSRTPDTLQKLIKDDEIIFGDDEKVQPRRKVFLTPESQRQMPSVIQDANRGKSDMEKLGLEFAYNHPVSLYDVLVGSAIPGRIGILLDFFAGSGTNGHTAISLNREDNGRRKYLLVEVGEQFDSVLKPRTEKVIYAGEWKDGKPQSRSGGVSQLVKYFRLESYEDALDNIAFEQADDSLLKMDDYVLSYMLDFETKGSATLLNVAQLDSPFDYKLYRHGKDDPLPVDLPETFNYLIGLHVKTRKAYENKGVRYLVYRGKSDDHETVVIWRTTRGWGQKEFDADRAFIAKQKITDGAEDVFVNTDSFVPAARSLDPVFKRRMFNEE
jgi:adenine-specific DNA-methyltransferase